MLEDWSCIRVFTCHVWEQGVVGGTIWWQICRLTLIDTNWQISCCLAKTKVQMALLTSHTSPWLLEACMGRGILTIKHWKVFQTKLGVDPPPPSGNARVLKAPVIRGHLSEAHIAEVPKYCFSFAKYSPSFAKYSVSFAKVPKKLAYWWRGFQFCSCGASNN